MLETRALICPRTGKIAVLKVFSLLTTPSGYPDAIIEMGYVDAIDSEVKETSNLHIYIFLAESLEPSGETKFGITHAVKIRREVFHAIGNTLVQYQIMHHGPCSPRTSGKMG